MRSHKSTLILLVIFCSLFITCCKKTMHKNKSSNKVDAILIGNSIIEYWGMSNTSFFSDNNYERKGIAGQTTNQILARFDTDVININPSVVVIEGGINDIAENKSLYDPKQTLTNIKLMAEKANSMNIKIVLSSLLPTDSIHWNPNLTEISTKVSELNSQIKAYADERGFIYADLYSKLADSNGKTMMPEYTIDGVHLSESGYKVIEPIIKDAIEKAMKNNY